MTRRLCNGGVYPRLDDLVEVVDGHGDLIEGKVIAPLDEDGLFTLLDAKGTRHRFVLSMVRCAVVTP